MAYVPNAGDTSQPVESQSVESAALEFRTLKTVVARGLRVPEATIGDIPTAAARAGKVLGFDAAGQPVGVEVSGVSDPSLRADLAASGGVGLVNGAASSGANTDITSIAGNAATASAANNGYFTAANSYPRLEIYKPGVMAGQWAIGASGNYVFESTNGAGVAASTLLTLTPGGVLSTSGGYSGNAATATKLASDTGSAPSYSCRAWVNFNGTGVVAIRASGNVSSVIDNGVGDYTVNFTTALVDVNACAVASTGEQTNASDVNRFATVNTYATTQVRVTTSVGTTSAKIDCTSVNVAVFH